MKFIASRAAIAGCLFAFSSAPVLGADTTLEIHGDAGLTLRELIEQAEQNINKADELIASQREEMRRALRAAEVRKACERAGSLAESGDLEGAKAEWNRALKIVRDRETKNRIIGQIRQAEAKVVARRAERKLKVEALNAEGTALFERGLLDESQARFRESLLLETSNPEARRYIESEIPARRNELRLQAAREERAKAAMENGCALVADGDLKGAIAKWREALGLTSDAERSVALSSEIGRAEEREARASSLAAEGASLFQSGNIQTAEAKFREALALDPMQLAAMDYLEVKVPARKAELQRLAAAEAVAKAAFEKGNRLFAAGSTDGAVAAWREADAATLDPELKAAVVAQFRKAEERAAAERAATAARLAALVRDGESLFGEDRLDEAEVKFRAALALDSSEWSSRQFVELLIPKRREELERLALVEKRAQEVAQRGEALMKTGDLNSAKSAFLEAAGIAEKPESKSAMMEKVAQLTSIQQHREVERQARIAALRSEGESLFKADSLDASAAKFNELLAVDASNPAATGYLNETIPARRAELERRAAVEKQVRAAYEEGAGKYSLGDLAGAIGAWEEALRIAEDAKLTAEINASLQKARVKTARIQALHSESLSLFSSDSLDASEAKFRELLALDAANADAKEYLTSRIPSRRAELQRKAEAEVRARAAYDRGNKLYAAGDYEGAKAAWHQALDIAQGQ
jgi:tetratricopeptide (TPR) repeat protein